MSDAPAGPKKSFTHVNGKKIFYNINEPPFWFGPSCYECGSDIGQVGFHGDGCSQNGLYKPFPTEAIRALAKGEDSK